MHAALVQRLMRDRSAWELTHVYDETPEPAEAELVQVDPAIPPETIPAHA
jgi:UDP-3-O-[3-hydroxymyristoyl] N-acetylglucosamine deacetylase